MPVALKISCYTSCNATLFLAMYMEYSSKLFISRAIRLTAQDVRPDDCEVQHRELLKQATFRARVGLSAAAIGVLLLITCYRYINIPHRVGLHGSVLSFLKDVPLMLLVIYILLFLIIV
jgi:hypothetical protein